MEVNEILRDYVGDLLAVENNCFEAIKRQNGDANFARYSDVLLLLKQIETTVKTQLSWLDDYSNSTGGGAKTEIKKAAASLAGAISGVYGKMMREDAVSRSLRDDYVTLTLIAVNCSMFHTAALALNETSVAEVALKHMNEIVPLVVELGRIIPSVVTRELAEENKIVDTSAWVAAAEKTREVWRNAACERNPDLHPMN